MYTTTVLSWNVLGVLVASLASWLVTMPDLTATPLLGSRVDSSTEADAEPEALDGPPNEDEFGLQWVGSFQDEPALGVLKTCVLGTRLACYCPSGLVIGSLVKCNSRSTTGVTFQLEHVTTFPPSLLEAVTATGYWMHMCKYRPCRREENGRNLGYLP